MTCIINVYIYFFPLSPLTFHEISWIDSYCILWLPLQRKFLDQFWHRCFSRWTSLDHRGYFWNSAPEPSMVDFLVTFCHSLSPPATLSCLHNFTCRSNLKNRLDSPKLFDLKIAHAKFHENRSSCFFWGGGGLEKGSYHLVICLLLYSFCEALTQICFLFLFFFHWIWQNILPEFEKK